MIKKKKDKKMELKEVFCVLDVAMMRYAKFDDSKFLGSHYSIGIRGYFVANKKD